MRLIIVPWLALGCISLKGPPASDESQPSPTLEQPSDKWPIAVELTIGQPKVVDALHAQITLLNGGFEHAIHSDGGGAMTYTGRVRFVRGDETVEHELRDDSTRTVWGYRMKISQIETVVLSIRKKAD
jgi:hypothetical protein